VLGQNRGTQRHRPRKVDGDRELLGVMRKIVETFPRHGSERTHRVLTGPEAFGGWKVNIKRVHRIWKEEHMQVPQKQRKRRRLPGSSANGCVRHRATHRNHVCERPPQPALTALIASRVDTLQPVFKEATHGTTGRPAEVRGMAAAAAAVYGIRYDGVEVLRSSGCIGRRFPLLAAEARSAAA